MTRLGVLSKQRGKVRAFGSNATLGVLSILHTFCGQGGAGVEVGDVSRRNKAGLSKV